MNSSTTQRTSGDSRSSAKPLDQEFFNEIPLDPQQALEAADQASKEKNQRTIFLVFRNYSGLYFIKFKLIQSHCFPQFFCLIYLDQGFCADTAPHKIPSLNK